MEPEDIRPVGNYAIHIDWKAGCKDGIYSFGFLRKLCSVDASKTPTLDKDEIK